MFEDIYSHDTIHETEQYEPYFQSHRTNMQSSKVDCTAALSKQSPWHNQNMKQQSSYSNTRSIKYTRRAVNAGWKTSMPTHTFIEKNSVRNRRLTLQLKKRLSTLAWKHQIQQQWLLSSSWVSQKKNHSLASLGLAPEKLDDQSNTRKTLFQPP